jgi:hypothetical protein
VPRRFDERDQFVFECVSGMVAANCNFHGGFWFNALGGFRLRIGGI